MLAYAYPSSLSIACVGYHAIESRHRHLQRKKKGKEKVTYTDTNIEGKQKNCFSFMFSFDSFIASFCNFLKKLRYSKVFTIKHVLT